jgi:hypothetical protein
MMTGYAGEIGGAVRGASGALSRGCARLIDKFAYFLTYSTVLYFFLLDRANHKRG